MPIGAVAAVVLITLYLFPSNGKGTELRVGMERMRTSQVEQGKFQEFIALNGSVVPINTFFLDAIEGGRVEKRFLEAGTHVEQGQKILQLANTNLLLDIMYREAELFQQSNNLRNTKLAMEQNRLQLNGQLLDLDYGIKQAERVYLRNKELYKKQLVSKETYETSRDEFEYLVGKRELTLQSWDQDSIFRENQVEQLESGLQRMEANLEVVKENLENLTIRAPVSGHLTSLNVEIGESKNRGERLGQIDILDGFKVRVPVDEHYITRVDVGQRAHFRLADETYWVTLTKIFPEVLNGQFQVEMTFETGEEPEDIRRGQTLHLRLELGEPRDAVLLDRGAFFQTTGGRWAYVLTEDGTRAEKREIRLGRQNQDQYEVLDGLYPGDEVITSSYAALGEQDVLIFK